ncbi:hypothetical protein [Anabaena sp. CCY 9402-a]
MPTHKSDIYDKLRLRFGLLESMGGIIRRTSLFNLGVQVSLHPAFDVLSV